MKIKLVNDDIKTIGDKTGDPRLKETYRYGTSNKTTVLDIDSLRPATVQTMIEFFGGRKAKASVAGAMNDENVVTKLRSYVELTNSPEQTRIKDVHSIVTALTNYIGASENFWLFSENSDGFLLPWFVRNIQYHPRERRVPEYVSVSLAAYRRTGAVEASMRFYSDDLEGPKATAFSLLESKGYYLEQEETLQSFNSELDAWKENRRATGKQMSASGTAEYGHGYWGGRMMSMERNGVLTKIVIDDEQNEEDEDKTYNRSRRTTKESSVESAEFWGKFIATKKATNTGKFDEESEDEKLTVVLPPHPYLRVFDLDKQEHCEIHSRNLSEYQWDETLIHKLVLPDDTKDLIEILIHGTALQLGDIVRGKMNGVIVIAVGDPGTGKTLTAEVFSEMVKKPLYTVQCSQLGLDIDDVEKNLQLILNRAGRWGAILLIDEADVYIRERGDDIKQNAIVGVFLRVLEYYRGVLFMTSNMATVLDDAIVSRATAYIRYQRPSREELKRIWKILADHFEAHLSKQAIELLVNSFPTITGRNVRSLIKLGSLLAKQRKVALDFELICHVARFQALESGSTAISSGAQRSKLTMKEMVSEMIEAMDPEQDITTMGLATALTAKYPELNERDFNNLKTSVSDQLAILVKAKTVVLTQKGKGSVPNVYHKMLEIPAVATA